MHPVRNLTPLSPFRLSVFSGGGTVWSDGAFLAGFEAENIVGDAGFGASYNVSALPGLDRWTAQSDVLQDLKIITKFPVWASDPDIINDSDDEWAFRWRLGIEL